ncbi:MAG: hypothetical protein ACKOCT_03265 [Alphaproteobacteria bacterium]
MDEQDAREVRGVRGGWPHSSPATRLAALVFATVAAQGCAALDWSKDVVGIRNAPDVHAAQVAAIATDRPEGWEPGSKGLLATEYLQAGARWRGVLRSVDGAPATSPQPVDAGAHRLTVAFEWIEPPDGDPAQAKVGECALDFQALPGQTYWLRTSHGRDRFESDGVPDPREWAAWVIEDSTWDTVSNGSCSPVVD